MHRRNLLIMYGLFTALLIGLLVACSSEDTEEASEAIPASTATTVQSASIAESNTTSDFSSSPGISGDPPVIWYYADQAFVEGCLPNDIFGTVQQFFNAYNAGDSHQLDRLIPEEFSTEEPLVAGPEIFNIYTVVRDDEQIFEARDRDGLMAYFEERHAKNERLVLRELGVWPFGNSLEQTAMFQFRAVLTADDYSERVISGGGTLNCGHHLLLTWREADNPNLFGMPSTTEP